MDLLDLWRGNLTPRRAAVLAVHLPDGAEVWLDSKHNKAWTQDTIFLRAVDFTTRILAWQQTEAGSKNQGVPEMVPEPVEEIINNFKEDTIEAKAKAFKRRQQERAARGE